MKKEILAAVLWGTVLPLAAAAALGRTVPEPLTTEPAPTVIRTPGYDRTTAVAVLTGSGEIRELELGDYLTGVVLAEMPADFEPEALKAQAVVARTYTCRRLRRGKHEGAAVCTDPGCCQGYRDPGEAVSAGSEAAAEKVRQAVSDTDGQVLTYAGELIDATYFSCSGGFTEDAVEVWGQDVPYLQAVESPGEEEAPRFSDRASFTAEQLRERLGIGGSGPVRDWFGPVTETAGGGVATMEICGERFEGTRLRRLLGLRSTAFTVSFADGKAVFETRGFGHRVGMSQYGAQAMAAKGKTAAEILAHYYRGAELAQLQN